MMMTKTMMLRAAALLSSLVLGVFGFAPVITVQEARGVRIRLYEYPAQSSTVHVNPTFRFSARTMNAQQPLECFQKNDPSASRTTTTTTPLPAKPETRIVDRSLEEYERQLRMMNP